MALIFDKIKYIVYSILYIVYSIVYIVGKVQLEYLLEKRGKTGGEQQSDITLKKRGTYIC